MGSYNTVLVGTDGSDSSYRAVDRAAAIARDAGATLLIATAFRPMTGKEAQQAADTLGHNAYKVTGTAPAEETLRAAAERALSTGQVTIDTAALQGEPVDVLVQLVKDRKVDLLVVGNRGLNSITGRLLGSVPSVVAHRATCDVLIVATT